MRVQRPRPARCRPQVAGRRRLTDRAGDLHQRGDRLGAIALDDPVPCVADLPPDGELLQPTARSRWLSPVQVALVAVLVIALGLAAWLRGETNGVLASAALPLSCPGKYVTRWNGCSPMTSPGSMTTNGLLRP